MPDRYPFTPTGQLARNGGGPGPPYNVPPGVPVAPTVVALGATATIPYPVLAVSPKPVPFAWCVLQNASPFTLLVVQGQAITQIAAFTADLVFVQPSAAFGGGIQVTPQPSAGTPATGVDSTVYATWYEDEPPGSYPSAIGAGTTQVAPSLPSTTAIASATSVVNLASFVQPWMQSLAIRLVKTGGTATGLLVEVDDNVDGTALIGRGGGASLFAGDWLYGPIEGRACTINTAPPIALQTFQGTIEVWGLSQRIATTIDTGGSTGAQGVRYGVLAQLTVPATTTSIVVPGLVGVESLTQKLRLLSWRLSTAPAAVSAALWLDNNGNPFLLDEVSTANPQSRQVPMGGDGVDIGRGTVSFQNAASVGIAVAALYDIVPRTLL